MLSLPVPPALRVRFGTTRVLASGGTLLFGSIALIGAAMSVMDDQFAQAPVLYQVIVGVVAAFAGLLALCTHAASRWIAYRLQGVPVYSISLRLFGELTDAAELKSTPRTEIIVGLSGLVTSFGLAGMTVAAHESFRLYPRMPKADSIAYNVTEIIMNMMIGFAVLQTVPGLPLDGGRVLRGLIWKITGNAIDSARAAALYAQVAAIIVMAGAVALMTADTSRWFWAIMVAGIGLQVGMTASEGFRLVTWQHARVDVSLAEVLPPIPKWMTTDDTVEDRYTLLSGSRGLGFLVINERGAAVGIVDARHVRGLSRGERRRCMIADIMTPIERAKTLPLDLPVSDAVAAMKAAGANLAVVMDGARPRDTVTLDEIRRELVARLRR